MYAYWSLQNSTIWEAAVLVLLMRVTYEIHRWEGLRWHDIRVHIKYFMKIGAGVQAILRFCLNNLNLCNVGITDGRDFWSEPLKWAEVAWCVHQVRWRSVGNLSKITVITANNLRDCNVIITDRGFLWSMPLRWLHVAWYTYQVWWRLVQAFRQY
jgi:hypothetical protein